MEANFVLYFLPNESLAAYSRIRIKADVGLVCFHIEIVMTLSWIDVHGKVLNEFKKNLPFHFLTTKAIQNPSLIHDHECISKHFNDKEVGTIQKMDV